MSRHFKICFARGIKITKNTKLTVPLIKIDHVKIPVPFGFLDARKATERFFFQKKGRRRRR